MAESRASQFYRGIIYGATAEQIGLIRWVVIEQTDDAGGRLPSRVSGYLYVGEPRTQSFAATSFNGAETGVGTGVFDAKGHNTAMQIVDGRKKGVFLDVKVQGQTMGLQGSGKVWYSLNQREGDWTFVVASQARTTFTRELDPVTGEEVEVRTDEGEVTDEERELADAAKDGPEAVEGWFASLLGGAQEAYEGIPLWGKVAAGLGFVAWWFKDELFGGNRKKGTKKRRK